MSRPQELDLTRGRHVIQRDPEAEPDPERLLAAVARAMLEVEVGRRPLAQIAPVLSPAVATRLAVRDDRARRVARTRREPIVGPDASTVLRVVGQRITGDAFEGVALVRRAGRVVAVAMRAERYRGRWRITELARPEDAPSDPDVRRRGSA